jgi:hypothetical protein
MPVIQYLIESGCHLDNDTKYYAAAIYYDNLDAMKYLYQNTNILPTECACIEAAKKNDIETLSWLIDNGFPLNIKKYLSANGDKTLEVYQYLTGGINIDKLIRNRLFKIIQA